MGRGSENRPPFDETFPQESPISARIMGNGPRNFVKIDFSDKLLDVVAQSLPTHVACGRPARRRHPRMDNVTCKSMEGIDRGRQLISPYRRRCANHRRR